MNIKKIGTKPLGGKYKLTPMRKPKAIALGFFYSSNGPRRDVLRLEIDLKDVSHTDRTKVIDQVFKIADKYGFCK